MSLHATLKVNAAPVGYIEIRRTWPDHYGPPSADTTCTYEFLIQADLDEPGDNRRGVVRHRYGDGAWVLVAKVLAEAKVVEEAERAR